jgi:hypothetical protein
MMKTALIVTVLLTFCCLFASAERLTVNIAAGPYEITSSDSGDEIAVNDFGRLLIPGKPGLPTRIFAIAIPPGAEINNVSFNAGQPIVLPGTYDIQPVPTPRVIGKEDPKQRARDLAVYEANRRAVYGSDNAYPAAVGEFVGKAGYRKYNLVDVRINPFVYRPASGRLLYYPEIQVCIDYTPSAQPAMVDNQARPERMARHIVYNYHEAQQWYPKGPMTQGLHDYVIITTDSLVSYVQPLVDWETAKGRTVEVVTTSWINSNYTGYDLAAKMRVFLREKYPSDQWGIEDVLLVGHPDDVPMRLTYPSGDRPECDFYYAELSLSDADSWDKDGDHHYGEESEPIDCYAEVNTGRIPWSNTSTVQHICEKSAAYEQNNDPAFKKNILLLGAFFWPDTDNAVLMEYKTDPSRHPWMSDWTMIRMYEDAQSPYWCDYDLNYNNVRNVWSAGKFAFVDWAGHGSPDAVYEYYPSQPFADENTCNYLNDEYPSIIFADSCSNSDTDYTNIGMTMLRQGGVGFLGSNKVAYGMPGWNDPTDGSSETLDYNFTTCCTSTEYTLGQALQYALVENYTHNYWYYPRLEHFEWSSVFGNPDLSMAMGQWTYAPDPEPYCNGALFGQPAAGYPGWVWFSIPLVPDQSADPQDLLGFDCSGTLFCWDKYLKAPQVYNPPFVQFDLAVGDSYLLWLDAGVANPGYPGSQPDKPFEFMLGKQGWTWVGMPGTQALGGDDFMNNVCVTFPAWKTQRTAAEDYAAPDPWLSWGWAFWDTYAQAARTFTPYAPFGCDTCYPWLGYRVYVNVGTAGDENGQDQVVLIWPE